MNKDGSGIRIKPEYESLEDLIPVTSLLGIKG